MIELLSPAGSPEAVIAAVQNGADAVYLGLENFNARRRAKNFTEEEFAKAVRYCRIRGCKVYVTINTLINDRELEDAVAVAHRASDLGADGIIIQDLGLIRQLHAAIPELPLHASTQMTIHNLAGVEAAAQLGLTRAVLARELSLEQIRYITKNASIETEVFVHGALCFCHSGQCYMSAMIGQRSGNRGMCAQPCRMQYSLGGRLDEYPLSMKDQCLADRLQELEDAGVASLKIEGRMKQPEYTGIVTGVYSKVLREHRKPTEEEMLLLRQAFSHHGDVQGFTQGYFNGDKKDMIGVRSKSDTADESVYARARKAYADGELRRVPVHFYSLVEKGAKARAIAFDDEGHRAVVESEVPTRARNRGLTVENMREQMFKTGGTPYRCVDNQAKVDPGLYLSAATINEMRRTLVNRLSEERARVEPRPFLTVPPEPVPKKAPIEKKLIFQVLTADQLTPELAELKPDYLYVPALAAAEDPSLLQPFVEKGSVPVAVLPRIITDTETEPVQRALEKLAKAGVGEALVGNLGHVYMPRAVGMKLRGDFGLNAFNYRALEVLCQAGFLSATASFELRLSQIRDMIKPLDVEMIVYGRLPLMVSDQCVIKNSSGRCTCQTPSLMTDRMGAVFPVVKEYGCRNVIYNAHKLFLADIRDTLDNVGVWGYRLMFSTESPRECVEVARTHRGLSDYRPNEQTKGLYRRGVE